MIRPSSWIASLAIVGSVCLLPLEAQTLSQKAKLEIRELHYDGPHVNPSDYNTMSLYVRATVDYGGDLTILENSKLIAGCWMNTEAASAEYPGKQWWDWRVSCFNNDYIYSPDFPRRCGEHLISIPLTPESRRLGCQNGAPAMPRCFQSTKPNRFVGWASGGAFHLKDDVGYDDVAVRQALPTGELPCHRHFELWGRVEGLEQGDQLQFHADLPNPATGAVEAWDVTIQPSTGTLLSRKNGSKQVAEGASYKARVESGPEKKTCTFNRNGDEEIKGTFVNVDDQGRTSGGIDLKDLSITCACKDGQTTCPHDRDLVAQTTGLEEGEAAEVRVTVTFPDGGSGADTYSINQNGELRVVTNLPGGTVYSAVFLRVNGRAGKICTIENGSGTIGAEDATFFLDCICPPPGSATSGGSVVAASTTGCGEPRRDWTDRVPEHEILDICHQIPRFCRRTLNPWWPGPGPGTGEEPCQRETICTDSDELNCWTNPETGQEICTPVLNCHDQCVPQSRVTLAGPFLTLDGDFDRPLGGKIRLSGWASDADGIAMLRLYLDDQRLILENFRDDVARPEACGPIQGDCSPVGFEGVLDTTKLADGSHRLLVFAVDGRSGYTVPALYEVDIMVANACTSTTAPTGALVNPVEGAGIAGTVPVEVQASAESGVERVRFYLDGLHVRTDWEAPYLWSWNTTGVADGPHELHAEVLDTCGNSVSTASRAVIVQNANDPPQLALETPTPLLQLSGIATVSGWAVDADSIESLSLRLATQVLPLASPVEWVDRSDVCGGSGVADPRCPLVGWRTSFDTTLWPDGAYSFQVVAVDGRGASASRSITLSIRNTPVAPPTVSTPASVTVVEGSDVSFAVSASGEGALGFRWQYRSGSSWISLFDGDRGGRVSGTGTHRLRLADAVTADQASYRCLVANEGGTTASSSASLTVEEVVAPPNVTAGLDQRVTEGTDAHLWVNAQGVGPLAYQWQKWGGSWVDVADGGRISGARTTMLTIANAGSGDGAPYRCRVSNEGGTTDSAVIELAVDPLPVGTCQEDATTLCFQADRFAVTATVNGGAAGAMPFSEEGGFFWMFEPQTVEVAIKILDGTTANGYFWVFHGSLTDLAYTVTVTDTITGASKTYLKGAGHFCGDADTAAFPDSTTAAATAGLLVPLAPGSAVARSSTACASSSSLACLLGGKFGVEVLRNGWPQPGVAVTDLSANFGFVSAMAPEVVVKVIDGTSVNGWYWLFFGSLTHQDFTVRVTDSATGGFRTYVSPGEFCGGADTAAF